MNKSYIVLALYDALREGKRFNTNDIAKYCNFSKRTATRYMNTIKDYLEECTDCRVAYDRKLNSFYIKTA